MADAVIVDDGGSTRIKRLMNGIGEMDKLLDVDNLTDPAGTRGSSDSINKTYANLLIVCQDEDGAPKSQAITTFTTIEVASELSQNVRLKKDAGGLRITIFGTGSDPIVEAKQHKKRRRYIVSNSGPIQTITVDGTLVYDVTNTAKLPAGVNLPIIYTSLVITP
jgi:hypothetical protein